MDRKRILLVDDEENLTRLIKLNLEATGNYEVMIENQGSLAIQTAKEFRPHLVIMDLMMPDMEGSEVAAQIKEDPLLRSVPIIFLTATVTSEEVTARGGCIGGEIFLAKPISVRQLINTIRERIGQ